MGELVPPHPLQCCALLVGKRQRASFDATFQVSRTEKKQSACVCYYGTERVQSGEPKNALGVSKQNTERARIRGANSARRSPYLRPRGANRARKNWPVRRLDFWLIGKIPLWCVGAPVTLKFRAPALTVQGVSVRCFCTFTSCAITLRP